MIGYDSVNHCHSSSSPRAQDETERMDELEALVAALDVDAPMLASNSLGGASITRFAAPHPRAARRS